MIGTFDAEFLGKTELTKGVYKFNFKLHGGEFAFKAGQYLIFMIPHEGKIVRRLYSLSSPEFHTRSFELIIQVVEGGIASTVFAGLKPGDKLQVQGPAGVFTLNDNAKPKIMLATGTGIAPMISMLTTHLTKRDVNTSAIMVFWGLRYKSDAYYVEEFRGLMKQYPQLQVRICLSREQANSLEGETDIYVAGRIDSILSNYVLNHPTVINDVNALDYYLCGSVAAVENLLKILGNAGVQRTNIFLEKFV